MKKVLTTLVLIATAALLFAGGGKEAPKPAEQAKPTAAPAAAQPAAPATKEAAEASKAISTTKFDGLVDIDYGKWELGKRGGSITLSALGDPKTFNIFVGAETSTTDILNRVYEGIMDRNNLSLEWEGELAEKWVIAPDNLSAVYTLRQGLLFSDGKPLTVDDVVFTYETIMNEKVKTNFLSGFKVGNEYAKITKIDSLNFKVTLPSVYAGLHNMMSFPVVPKHVFEPLIKEKGIEAVNSFWGVDTNVKTVVGCGPYIIDEYVPAQKVVLKRNPNYWRKDSAGTQMPYLDSVQYLIVTDQNAAFLKFQAGELDTYGLRGQDYADLVTKKSALGFELYNAGPDAGTQFVVFNQNPNGVKDPVKLALFNDKRFRKAMAHLVDRQTIVDNIQYGFGFPQYSFIPTFSPYFWKGSEGAAAKFNPESAKKILDEMGWKDTNNDGIRDDGKGNKLSFVLVTNSNNPDRVKIGELFATEAKKIGLDVTFKPGDFNAMVGSLTQTFDWEAIVIGLTGSVDPISGANVYPSSGNLHMVEPLQVSPRRDWEKEVDKQWNIANLTLDEAQRKAGYEAIQRIWLEENPWIYTTNAAIMAAYKNKFGNVKPRPVSRGFAGIAEYIYIK